jgi:hypothetical protein
MKTAILGWGSLLWEGGLEFDKWHGPWQYDGPTLRIEFSRVSKRRLGALTLVIDREHGSPVMVAWCLSKRERLDDAICDLRCREDAAVKDIGYVRADEQTTPQAHPEKEEPMIAWARGRKLDAVIWTALESNFAESVKSPFSVDSVISYMKALDPAAKAKAAEYVWRAPPFVKTPVRSALQTEPWFSNPEN